jgi:nicotinamide phosphoribosyltransferase
MKKNILLSADSYKTAHSACYPPNATAMESYIEARGGGHLLFFGLQMFIQDYLLTPITQADIDEAVLFYETHGVPFDKEMWQYILDTYQGYMPVRIEAPKEGQVIPNGNAVVVISCHDSKCFSAASWLETALLRSVWYPSSVATYSYDCKQIIKKYLDLTSDVPEQIAFKLHDFGARGVSSGESAEIGGCAHLVNFMGSDTVEGIVKANKAYGCASGMAAYSIPATEHSTITSWGQANESAAYKNFLDKYLKKGKFCACVSDSYDIMKACDIWGTDHKEQIMNSGGTLVVRPDSGEPAPTVLAVVRKLESYFGSTKNSKGFSVLPDCIRVIQGDGINKASIDEILSLLKFHGYAADNVGFGMGGQLLQIINRDTFSFAMKCCAIKINGIWEDVYKIAPGKNSKKGRLTLVKINGEFKTVRIEDAFHWTDNEVVIPMMEDAYCLVATQEGFKPMYRHQTLDEVRELSIL